MSDVGHSARASRFVFDRVFSEKPFNSDAMLSQFSPAGAVDEPAPQCTASELETARQLGFEEGLRQGREEGHAEGRQAALSEAEARTNAAFAALAEQMADLAARQDEIFDALTQDCERLIHVILERLLPELVRRGGSEEIIGVVKTALDIACNDPVVEVRVPHEIVEPLRPSIARLTHEIGFRGRVDLLGDSYLTGSMVRVRWLHGGAQRDPDQMQAEVSAVVARILEREDARDDAPPADASPITETKATET
jgi:flagellar biosynthesis/type III secretory pathway protein FliH